MLFFVNQVFQKRSVVGYCHTIDASSTEFSTIYTLLVRSIKMADEIGQHDVSVVFDQAIYAKAVGSHL